MRQSGTQYGRKPVVDLARQYEETAYRRVDRRRTAISMFAFFATIFTLGWFSLSHWEGTGETDRAASEESAPAGETGPAPRAAPPVVEDASGRTEMPDEDEYRDFYALGDQVADWFEDFGEEEANPAAADDPDPDSDSAGGWGPGAE